MQRKDERTRDLDRRGGQQLVTERVLRADEIVREPDAVADGKGGPLALDAPRVVAAGYAAGPIHAKARIEGRKVALDGNAAAYGATATVAGNVTLPDMAKDAAARTLAFDVNGQLRRIDLRKMPRNLNVPPAETDVNASYRAAGSVPIGGAASPQSVRADLTFQPTTAS